MALRRIGQILVDMGFISDDQLTMLLEEQEQRPGQLLGKIAQELQLVTEEQLVQALSEQLGLKVVELGDITLPADLANRITESMAQLYRVVPVKFEHNTLTVATCDPQNITIQDELRSLLGYEIKIVIARRKSTFRRRSIVITLPTRKRSRKSLRIWKTTTI